MSHEIMPANHYAIRWHEPVPNGTHQWHIRRIGPDLSFWGYAHVRSSSASENHSFEGQLPLEAWQQALGLIHQIEVSDLTKIEPSEIYDGVLLSGDASTGKRLIACSRQDVKTSQGANAFYALTDLLQPYVSKAIRGG
jgi:hypothetical protein